MTVVDESELGSYFQLTPRPSLDIPLGDSREGGVNVRDFFERKSGPPPLVPVLSPPSTAEQPINLSAVADDNRHKESHGEDPNVLDLSSKPLNQLNPAPSGASPQPGSSVASAFVPPKAHADHDSPKFCRLCSREIELALVADRKNSGLCLACIARSPAEAPPAPSFGLSALLPGLLPSLTALLPGLLPPIFSPPQPAVLLRNPDVADTKAAPSPPSSCESAPRGSPPSSPSFFCAKCNINFRNSSSLEAHLADYCQRSGQVPPRRGAGKRRPGDATPGQDLVCQICGYRGHSERGIRVHFNAMHSIGSEIQLEQYLSTMIARGESGNAGEPAPNDATPSTKRRRLEQTQRNAEALQLLSLIELTGINCETSPGSRKSGSSQGSTPSNGSVTMTKNGFCTDAQLNASNSLRRQPPFECRLCTKTFPDTAKLRLHMRSHEMDETVIYSCKRCNNFTTPVKSDLVRHVKTEHEGGNLRLSTWTVPRTPSLNDASGSSSNSSDDGPMFCDVCQIPFKFRHSYDAHRRYYCMAKWNNMTDELPSDSSPSPTTVGGSATQLEDPEIDENSSVDVTS